MPNISGQTEVRNNTNKIFYLRGGKKAQKTDLHLEYEYISIATMNAARGRIAHSHPILHRVTIVRHRLLDIPDPGFTFARSHRSEFFDLKIKGVDGITHMLMSLHS